jgi:hypothetical protein
MATVATVATALDVPLTGQAAEAGVPPQTLIGIAARAATRHRICQGLMAFPSTPVESRKRGGRGARPPLGGHPELEGLAVGTAPIWPDAFRCSVIEAPAQATGAPESSMRDPTTVAWYEPSSQPEA